MSGWISRTKTTFVTNAAGEAVAVARVITYPDGRSVTVPACDLTTVKLERRAQGCEFGKYQPPLNLPLSISEMRSRASSLLADLGLKKRAKDDAPECSCPCEACQNPDDEHGGCEHCDCGGCDSEACENETCMCEGHRFRRLHSGAGRTIFPFSRAVIEQERQVEQEIYEARRRMRLAAPR